MHADSELLPEAVPALDPVGQAIHALSASVTDTQALPGPSYALCFPILAAVLSTPDHTRLHDMALAVVSLHVSPGRPLPRRETLALLYNVLEIMPAYRSVCLGRLPHGCPATYLGLGRGTHQKSCSCKLYVHRLSCSRCRCPPLHIPLYQACCILPLDSTI